MRIFRTVNWKSILHPLYRMFRNVKIQNLLYWVSLLRNINLFPVHISQQHLVTIKHLKFWNYGAFYSTLYTVKRKRKKKSIIPTFLRHEIHDIRYQITNRLRKLLTKDIKKSVNWRHTCSGGIRGRRAPDLEWERLPDRSRASGDNDCLWPEHWYASSSAGKPVTTELLSVPLPTADSTGSTVALQKTQL